MQQIGKIKVIPAPVPCLIRLFNPKGRTSLITLLSCLFGPTVSRWTEELCAKHN